MDNLTHSLVGAVIGQAGLKRKTGLAMPALIFGANLPDVDAACFFWLDGVEHLAFRRGITHGPIAWILLPLVLAALLYGWDHWQTRRGQKRFGRPEGRLPVHFGWLYALSLIGCLTHPALDWLNVYGIRLLEPFSSRWFYGDVLFIIDVWLWAILGIGVWLSLRREKRGGDWRKAGRLTAALASAYLALNWINTQLVAVHAPSHDEAVLSPRPLMSWEREVIAANGDGTYLVDGEPIGDAALWRTCDLDGARRSDRQVAAFLFWSRMPLLERGPDGSVLVRDARYYDPRARDRFTVALPNSACEPLP